jgi:uncharacterized protein GlcG (DUF336 family)
MTTSAHSKSFTEASTSRDAALALVEAVRAASEQIGFGAAIAVTDHGGHLRAFERSDETPFLAGTVATDKAWTASSYRIVTHQWNAYLADPEVAPLGQVDRLVAIGGGYPIVLYGQVLGGLGVSGGNVA